MNTLLAMQSAVLQSNTISDGQHCDGVCPSCGCHTQFTYCGEQVIPANVALAVGLPTVLHLWHCTSCWSTLSEGDLSF